MAMMTNEEADTLDELMTNADLKPGPNGAGFFSNRGYQVIALDEETSRILNAQSIATSRSPSELVADLVKEKLAVAM